MNHSENSYHYEETGAQPPAVSTAANAKRLGQLPGELITNLLNATVAGNKKLLNKLILQLRETEDAGSRTLCRGLPISTSTTL